MKPEAFLPTQPYIQLRTQTPPSDEVVNCAMRVLIDEWATQRVREKKVPRGCRGNQRRYPLLRQQMSTYFIFCSKQTRQ